jgi:hypothetical protein
MMLCIRREELHAAAGVAITGNDLSHVAVKATEATAPEAALLAQDEEPGGTGRDAGKPKRIGAQKDGDDRSRSGRCCS